MVTTALPDQVSNLQRVKTILGPRLMVYISQPRSTFGDALAKLAIWTRRILAKSQDKPSLELTADGMIIVTQGWPVRATGGYTLGNYVFPCISPPDMLFLIHEYVHVLQWRAEGAAFVWHYARAGFWNWPRCDAQGWPMEFERANRYEMQAMQVEACYQNCPNLPLPWQLQRVN
jgi:hypothetical protein